MSKLVIAAIGGLALGTIALSNPAEARCWWNGYDWHCSHHRNWHSWNYWHRHHYSYRSYPRYSYYYGPYGYYYNYYP
jgi:hypothetical protein